MPQELWIRAPFKPVATVTPSKYSIEPTLEQTHVIVQTGESGAGEWQLQPVFPGTLTFKPTNAATVPPNGGLLLTTDVEIEGDLFLELSYNASRELKAESAAFGYPFLIAYRGVKLGRNFFNGTVIKALQISANSYRKVLVGGQRLNSNADRARHFALGAYGLYIKPGRTAASAYAFPQATGGAVTLEVGVRTGVGPLVDPKSIAAETPPILRPRAFVPIPLPFFYRTVRNLPSWGAASSLTGRGPLVADGHAAHSLFAALDALEDPTHRWRELRIFPIGERTSTIPPLDTYDSFTATATTTSPIAVRNQSVSRLGQVFEQRPDGESFRLTLATSAGTAVDLSAHPILHPDPGLLDYVDATWDGPLSGTMPPAPAGIDVSAEFEGLPDPIAAGIRLSFGYRDGAGVTLNAQSQPVYAAPLIRPLKALLTRLGFGITKVVTDVYDEPTRHAVREFQREARKTQRWQNDGPVDVAVTYNGPIDGDVNPLTLTLAELGVWRDNGYRAVNAFTVTLPDGTGARVDYPSRDIAQGVVTVEPGGLQLGTVPSNNTSGLAASSGIFTTAGLTVYDVWDECVGAVWQKKAVGEVAFNESGGSFQSLNTWDRAFLSVGLFHWILGTWETPPGQSPSYARGELPAVCSLLSASSTNGVNDFDRLLGTWGLSWSNVMGTPGYSFGQFALDGVPVATLDLLNEFRSFRWSNRFRLAASDPAFRRVQWQTARDRISVVNSLQLQVDAFGGNPLAQFQADQLLQSEFLVAVALDQHVNSPASVHPALIACANALRNPDRLFTANLSAPGTWLDDAIDKRGRVMYGVRRAQLSVAQLTNLRTLLRDELDPIKQFCQPNNANTPAIVFAPNSVSKMTQAQETALERLYSWRRQNTGGMDYNDAKRRWDSIAAGGHTRLAPLSHAPGQFTP